MLRLIQATRPIAVSTLILAATEVCSLPAFAQARLPRRDVHRGAYGNLNTGVGIITDGEGGAEVFSQ